MSNKPTESRVKKMMRRHKQLFAIFAIKKHNINVGYVYKQHIAHLNIRKQIGPVIDKNAPDLKIN